VRVRRAERVQERAREVEVLRTLIALVPNRRRPFAGLQGQPLAQRYQIGDVGFGQIELLRVAEERRRVVEVAEDSERVVLLGVDAGGDDDAPAEPIALGR
jgi:hypothetical protein